MKLKSEMPKSLILKTPSTVIEANIPIQKSKRSDDTGRSGGSGTEESKTRRTHRQRMKAFLTARSVA